MSETVDKPECFGSLETVFPVGPDGLRSVKDACSGCPQVKSCLKAAAASPDGLSMRAERLEACRSHMRGGLTGFLSRWSELKSLRRGAAGRRNNRE